MKYSDSSLIPYFFFPPPLERGRALAPLPPRFSATEIYFLKWVFQLQIQLLKKYLQYIPEFPKYNNNMPYLSIDFIIWWKSFLVCCI